ncbi:RICIN domain-containing protein [Collinsella tanakaei]|uniref:RICIN domain-containing protein n=1 Tax=Collinsella tanakaei TaxID=626935 RepID=UPI0022E33BB8|nr:RICIN domain-containing protein [Collinsella tanakaei]
MNKLSRTWRPGARASVMAGLACASLVCSLAMPPTLVAMAQTTSSTSSPVPSQAAAADTADQSTTAPSTPNADVTADGTGGDTGDSVGNTGSSTDTAAPADPTDPTAPGTATDSAADDATTPATPDNITTQDAPAEETPAPDNDRAALDALAAQHAAAVADGTYAIASSASQAANQRGVLDVQGASAAGGATIQLYASNGTGAQRWRVTHDDTGYVTFINAASGLALDVQWGNSAAGTPVQQYTPNGSWSQKWIVISLDEESGSDTTATAFPTRCIIVSALAPNIALDLRGGSIASTTPVQIWDSNHSAAQTFTFIDASPAAPAVVEDGTLPQGWFSLKPQCAPASGVDIYNASRNNNANAQLWSANGTFAQLFTFKYCNGYYLIVNAASGKALDVEMADVVPGTNVQQYQASEVNPAQLWAPVANADGSYTFINKATGMALNIDGAASYNGANVNAYTPNGSAAQRFTLAKQTNLLAEGIYTLGASAATNSVLEVSGASQAAGASVQAYASNGTLAQRWRIALVPGAENTYTIQNLGSAKFLTADSAGTVSQRAASGAASGTSAAAGATAASLAQQWTPVITAHGIAFESVAHPGRVLDLTAGSTANGTRLQLWQANGSSAQAFALASTTDALPNGTYTLTVANTNLAIDVANASYASGANVQVFQSNNSGAQKWNVTRNADGTYTIVNAASGKALDVAGGSAYSGANVQQYQPNGSAAQRWNITFDADGYKIASAAGAGGACVLDVSGGITSNGSAANGGNLQVYQSNNSTAQRFTLQPTTYVPPMPPTQLSMYTRAQGRFSATNRLIMVDTTNCRVGIFSGGMGYWNMDAYWTCSTGKPSTPTVVGEFTVTGKGYSFGENHGYSCYYYTQFYGDYLIHSIQYYANSFRVMDGRLGVHVSNGCIRMSIDQAKWIYDNIPYGTKVVTYR